MANWKHTIDLTDIYCQYEEDKMTIEQVSDAVADIFENFIKANPDMDCYDLEMAVDSLRYCDDADDFDSIMDDVYAFADWHYIWIETMNFGNAVLQQSEQLLNGSAR